MAARGAAVQPLAPAADADCAAVRAAAGADDPDVVHDRREINPFPPKLIPTGLHLDGYSDAVHRDADAALAANTVLVVRHRGDLAPGAVLAGRATASPGSSSPAAASRFFAIVATIMIPIQLLMIPTFLMFARARHRRHPGRGVRAVAGLGVRHLPDAAVLPVAAGRARGGGPARRVQHAAHVPAASCCRWPSPALATLAIFTLLRVVERPDLAADRDQRRPPVHAAARAGQLPGHPAHRVVAADGRQRRGHHAADPGVPVRAADSSSRR